MNAVPNNVVAFELPKKPRVKQKDAPPDQRSLAIIPIRAGRDERLHGATLRTLIVLCSYCNRAGITWVSQKRLAEDLKVSRQAITKQFKVLTDTGYIEVIRKGFRGERSNTVRVIFDPSIKTEDAIAATSSIEDTRPPAIRHEQEKEMEEQIDREGQKRIAQMLSNALKQPNQPKDRTMPKEGDTLAVRKIKEGMKKAPSKRTHKQPLGVANEAHSEVANEGSHRQPDRQPLKVAQNSERTHIESPIGNSLNELNKLNTVIKTVLSNQDVEQLKSHGLTEAGIADALDVLLPAYKAEGLTPTSRLLADSILQLHRDVR